MPSTYFDRPIRSNFFCEIEKFEADLQNFLVNANSQEKKYSLRAMTKQEIVANGNECVTYHLFKRDGTESFLEKIINWYCQDE